MVAGRSEMGRARALSELLTEDELLAELTCMHADLTKAYARFRELVADRRLVTGALIEKGVSQRRIAAHLGVSSTAVTAYMRGVKDG